MAELDEIIRRCNILGCKMIVVKAEQGHEGARPDPTRKEIREDAVAVLRKWSRSASHRHPPEPEFCGEPSMTINRFEDAYAIVEEVNSPYVGVTLDQYHFYAMGSGWDTSKSRRQEDFRMASERHRGTCRAARTTTTTRSVCGRVPRATACRMRALRRYPQEDWL